MNAPFRDLFVELPLAVFEALQGIAEAAVARTPAWSTALPRDTVFDALRSRAVVEFLCMRYGWRSCEWRKASDRVETDLIARLHCRHSLRISFTDWSLEDGNPGRLFGDVIVRRLDKIADGGRPCFCVQRPECQ